MNEKTRVLVADDDRGALILMQAALQNADFEVTTVRDGLQALEQASQGYDLVMLDVDMPGRNGYEVCVELRRRYGPLLPVVMVTGMDDTESVDAAYRAGATDFIPKPINWGLLGHRVRYLLRAYENARRLARTEAGMRALLAALPDTLWEVDAKGRVVHCHAPHSPATARLLRNPLGRHVSEVLPEPTHAVCRALLQETLETGVSRGRELALSDAQGVHYFELTASRKDDAAGTAPHVVVLAREVTERRHAEERIRHLAYFDALTGLPNRELFRDELARAIDVARRADGVIALLCIDLDNFKRINDTLGHSVGDELLRMTAERMREALRTRDSVARRNDDTVPGECLSRLGGDEFMILLPQLKSSTNAGVVAERVVRAIARPMRLAQHEVFMTPSVGIAVFPTDGADAETLVRNADLAMYFAKRQGPGAYAFFNQSMNADALKRLTIENRLRTALERNELSLNYQPQFDVATGALSGMEALLRWNNPELGLVPPAEFIAVAEDTGLIIPMGEWVLRAACVQAMQWSEGGAPTRIAVNVSGRQLLHMKFAQRVANILAETGLPARLLELEITESVLMENAAAAESVLRELRALGVAVAIDDFGTGYSSFNRLRELPIDRLKIDRLFIQRLQDNEEDRAIAAAIIRMAETMHLDVVAEGVEDLAQLMVLQEERCSQAQGFLFSRPLPAGETLEYLRRAAAAPDATRTERLRRMIGAAS